jgi:hypothetical protein
MKEDQTYGLTGLLYTNSQLNFEEEEEKKRE